MLTQKTVLAKAKKFLTECHKLPVRIDKAILFESALNGKFGKDSDIDLALFSESFTDNILSNLHLIGSVNIHFPEIDVHTYLMQAYSGAGFFIDEIKRTGLEII